MKRHYALLLIDSAKVVENLRNVDNCQHEKLPANEAQARPLTQLDTKEDCQRQNLHKPKHSHTEGRKQKG